VAASADKEERRRGWLPTRLNAVAGMFVAIFEGELGDAGFVELAQAFGHHVVVLFLRHACEWQIETEIPRELTPKIIGDFIAREPVYPRPPIGIAVRARINLQARDPAITETTLWRQNHSRHRFRVNPQ
jgi:hypothetical protein